MVEWEVAKTQGVCVGCSESLQPGQEYFAGLFEQADEGERPEAARVEEQQAPDSAAEQCENPAATAVNSMAGFKRNDYCLSCWENFELKAFCFWRTRVPQSAEKQKLLVDDEVLLTLFERLAEAQQRVKVNLRFVLALILMRKRILKYERTDIQNGRELWIMGQVREQTKHEVVNPRLDEAQIQEVSEQLSSILRSEL